MVFILGFTGSRRGATAQQLHSIRACLQKLLKTHTRSDLFALHGDALGADAQFDSMCQDLGIQRVCRPCFLDEQRAFTSATVLVEATMPLERNKLIVADCNQLLACPNSFEEEKRSGTWATVREAKHRKKRVVVVLPDGRFSVYEPEPSPPKPAPEWAKIYG